jgi:hypothetical protein
MARIVLDMSGFATTATDPRSGQPIDVEGITAAVAVVVDEMIAQGLVESNDTESFGFAATHLFDLNDPDTIPPWDDPEDFTWFVSGGGDEQQRYEANGLRKLRDLLRNIARYKSTLEMRMTGDASLFSEVVESKTDGQLMWGSYPWGGGVIVCIGTLAIGIGFSGVREIEDHHLATFIGTLVLAEIMKLRNPAKWFFEED